MLRTCLLPAILSLAALVRAQSVNVFEIYPDAVGSSTTFSSRFNLGRAAGEMHTVLPNPTFRATGDFAVGGSKATMSGFRLLSQDQDGSTQTGFYVVFRRQAATGGPDVSRAGRIYKSGVVLNPKGSQGPSAWLLTVAFQTPVSVPPDRTWFYGAEIAAAVTWPNDGMSVHCADYTAGVRGDNPRAGAMNFCWGIDPTATPQVHQPSPRTMRAALLTNAPLLNPGGVDLQNTRQAPKGSPNYGAGGVFPDIADASNRMRFDDLTIRVRDAGNPNGFSVIFLDVGTSPILISVPGWHGSVGLSVGPLFHVYGVLTLDAKGSGEIKVPLGPGPGAVRRALRGKQVYWQGLNLDPTLRRIALTNVGGHRF